MIMLMMIRYKWFNDSMMTMMMPMITYALADDLVGLWEDDSGVDLQQEQEEEGARLVVAAASSYLLKLSLIYLYDY